MADKKACEAALQAEVAMNYLTREIPSAPEKQLFSESKEETFRELGAIESGGKWTLPDGRGKMSKND